MVLEALEELFFELKSLVAMDAINLVLMFASSDFCSTLAGMIVMETVLLPIEVVVSPLVSV